MLSLLFITCISFHGFNQAITKQVNKRDSNGLKQGLWIKTTGSLLIDSMIYVNDSLNGPYTSHNKKNKMLLSRGVYAKNQRVGIWKYYDLNKLVAEEYERGVNKKCIICDTVKAYPQFYSYVRLYNLKQGYLENQGMVYYSDSWDSDLSQQHGKWLIFNSKGDTIKIITYCLGNIKKIETFKNADAK